MIQLSETPQFPTQLKFNLDGSVSSAISRTFTSPQVIFMQKLSQTPAIVQRDRQHVSMQPLSDRLKFAQQLAKMDARCVRSETKMHKRQDTAKVEKKSKSNVKLFQTKPRCKNASTQAIPFKSSKKASRPAQLHHLHPNQNLNIPPLPSQFIQYAHEPPTKDACVSTADISIRETVPIERSPRTPNFCNTKASLGLIKKEKLDKSFNSTRSSHLSTRFQTPKKLNAVKAPSATAPQLFHSKPNFTPVEECDRKPFVEDRQYFVPTINAASPSLSKKTNSRIPGLDLQSQRSKPAAKYELNTCPQTLDEQVSYMCSTLHQQLLEMESVENDIRTRWKGIKYDMMSDAKKPFEPPTNVEELQSPINLQGGKSKPSKPGKDIVQFVKKRPELRKGKSLSNCPLIQTSARTLSLPMSTIDAVYKNKSTFNSYLHSVHHKPVGKFDPWRVVNELSKEVVDKIVSDVCDEVSDGFDQCVEHVFEAEFAMPP